MARVAAALLAPLLLTLFLLSPLLAAPQAKRPAPKADEVVGWYKLGSKDGPIVAVPRQDDEPLEFWLVFAANPDAEAFARALKEGDRVRVRGRIGHGGGYAYLLVAEIDKDE